MREVEEFDREQTKVIRLWRRKHGEREDEQSRVGERRWRMLALDFFSGSELSSPEPHLAEMDPSDRLSPEMDG